MSLGGAVACVAVIVFINPLVGGFAVLAEAALWWYLSRRERRARWGDARRGLYESLVRWALIKLAARPMSARNWRPHILVFVGEPASQLDLVRFGDWFSQGRGVVTVCELIVGDLFDERLDVKKKQEEIAEFLNSRKLAPFAKVNVVSDVVEGITNVAQADGLAALESNTVLLGWPKNRERLAEFLRVMRRLEHLKKSFILGKTDLPTYRSRSPKDRTIHVWWGGLERNGDLMLLLAYLLTRNPEWRGSGIRVMSIASTELMKEQTEKYLERLLPEIRIEAERHVVLKPRDMTVRELIHRESRFADVVFFGLATPQAGEEESYAERVRELAGELPNVFFIKNSSLFIGELLAPEGEN